VKGLPALDTASGKVRCTVVASGYWHIHNNLAKGLARSRVWFALAVKLVFFRS